MDSQSDNEKNILESLASTDTNDEMNEKNKKKMNWLMIAHSISHLFHFIASICLYFSWKTIQNDCTEVVDFIAKLHVILAAFYGLIGSGKLAVILGNFLGKTMGTRVMSVICAILSAKVYILAMMAEAILEVATFSPNICTFPHDLQIHLWLSRLFFIISLFINAIFLSLSIYFHPSNQT